MDPIRQLKFAVLVVFALIALGTFGYSYIENMPLLDALYMTVITITTVGYREVHPLSQDGKIFTIVLILAGVSTLFTVVFWTIGNAIEFAATERMQHLFWRRRMQKSINSVKNHYIVCGYGRMGQAIASEFRRRNIPFVVVENNPEQLPKLVAERALFVEGDATDEKVLLAAGVERARGLISVAPTDADNTFIVLTAKGLNPNLYTVARSIKVEDEPKLRRAGADRVMSPYILGGKRMAWAALRPTVVDFLENALYSEEYELEISEVTVSADSEFVGKTLRESGIREKSGANVIALKTKEGALTPSPSPDVEIREGDILVVLGTPKQLEALQKLAKA
ncbi:MAG: potassium channel protein [Armatimonadetes bacterium]|nr:potassium channel protein [Armatimonadota bacterium]